MAFMAERVFQGEGVFEIVDHTTASNWERFIANLEEILTEWNISKQSDPISQYRELPAGFISRSLWCEKRETIRLEDFNFDIIYQFLDNIPKDEICSANVQIQSERDSSDSPTFEDADSDINEFNCEKGSRVRQEDEREFGEYELPKHVPDCVRDLVSTKNDYASKAHCLVRWYNLRGFIILIPRGDTIVSEDRVKLILSSASVALANTDCHVPIFVQIRNPKNNFYQGISEGLNIRTTYEMIYYRKALKHYEYLSELISVFREKTNCSLTDPISATVRLNYCLENFDLFVEASEQFTGNERFDEDELVKLTTRRRTGARTYDMKACASFEQVVDAMNDCDEHPYRILKFLHVAAIWPPVSDKVITDTQVHSDLDPAEAPVWSIRCVANDSCNMRRVHETKALHKFFSTAIDYAYDKLDAGTIFDSDRETLDKLCLKLSFDLATQPEVILSQSPTDCLRKLVALLFYQASELMTEFEALDQIAGQLKKKPSLSEIYRSFGKQRPSVKEFIIRTTISRPFNPISTPALPQRMFCTVCDEEFRICGAFSELCC